jgi:hypothetical protein
MENPEILAKIEALKAEFTGKLDELSSSISGGEEVMEGETESPVEVPEGEVAAPEGGEEEVPAPYAKKKPGGMMDILMKGK